MQGPVVLEVLVSQRQAAAKSKPREVPPGQICSCLTEAAPTGGSPQVSFLP